MPLRGVMWERAPDPPNLPAVAARARATSKGRGRSTIAARAPARGTAPLTVETQLAVVHKLLSEGAFGAEAAESLQAHIFRHALEAAGR